MKRTLILTFVTCAAISNAQLYGVGGSSATGYEFYNINTSTGAATSLFTFVVPGSTGVVGLTYVPTTNKFLTVASIDPWHSELVELDLGAQTGTVMSTGIPLNSNNTAYFEGLEYMSAYGGVVISHGPGGFYSGKLAVLNPVGYGMTSNNGLTGIPDADVVFMDGSGDLNIMDTNNPYSGNMRNKVTNPFGSISLAGYGSNMFVGTDSDFAWKQDEGRLFLTRGNSLAEVNATSTVITNVGGYGANSNGVVVNITGIAAKPVPEPATFAALGLGAIAILKRRKK